MGTSEVHLPEGENLIGFFSERSFTYFLFFYYVSSCHSLSDTSI